MIAKAKENTIDFALFLNTWLRTFPQGEAAFWRTMNPARMARLIRVTARKTPPKKSFKTFMTGG